MPLVKLAVKKNKKKFHPQTQEITDKSLTRLCTVAKQIPGVYKADKWGPVKIIHS